MKQTLFVVAITTSFYSAIAVCQKDFTTQHQELLQTQKRETTGKAELGSFGIELDARDLSVKPGDDFFMYAGGTWYKNYKMPADKNRYGAFSKLVERSEAQVKAIIDDISAKQDLVGEEKLVADFYNAYMDVERINSLGLKPIQSTLNSIHNIATKEELIVTFGKSWLEDSISPISTYVWFNNLNPDEYQVYFGAGGIGMPDRDYYLEQEERFKDYRKAYVTHVAEVLAIGGLDMPKRRAQSILELEIKIAEAHWPREKRRDRDLILNQVRRENLGREYPGFDWNSFITQTGFALPSVNVSHPEPIRKIITLIEEEPTQVWKDYLLYHTINNNADLLSEDIYQSSFNFYGKIIGGQLEPTPRWKRAISEMSGTQKFAFVRLRTYF